MKTTTAAVIINVVLLSAISITTMAQRYYNNNQNNNNSHIEHHYNNYHHNNDNNQYQGTYGVYNGGTNSYAIHNSANVYTNYPLVNINLSYNPWYYKNEAKNVLRVSKYTINEAQNISLYNANYTPLLALAMRHHLYAKQLYFSANYAAAINHAQRAKSLAQEAVFELTVYNNFNNANWNNENDDEYGFRKNTIASTKQPAAPTNATPAKPIQYTSLDNELPASTINDNDRVTRKME